MQDVQDEPLFAERVAGLDIAKAMVEVAIRVPSDTTAGRPQQETRTLGATPRELESLGDRLAPWGRTPARGAGPRRYLEPGVVPLQAPRVDCPLDKASP